MEIFNNEVARKVIFGVTAVFLVLGLLSGYLIIKNNKKEAEQFITVERVTGKYKLLSYENKKGFYITVKEINTGKVYEDSFVSQKCLLAEQKSIPGKEVELTRFGNMNLVDNSITFFFKGAYEQLCTNLSYNSEKGDNYFKM